MGGTDDYENLVLVNQAIHKLIHASTKETTEKYKIIGFPACWIVVPGVSNVFTANNLIARIKAYSSKRDLLARLAANKQDEQTEKLLMNYILFDEYNFYSGNKLFDNKIKIDRLGAFLALKLGDYEESKHN